MMSLDDKLPGQVFNGNTYALDILFLAKDLVSTIRCELDPRHTAYSIDIFANVYNLPRAQVIKDAQLLIESYDLLGQRRS